MSHPESYNTFYSLAQLNTISENDTRGERENTYGCEGLDQEFANWDPIQPIQKRVYFK